MMSGIERIAAERQRQIDVEGWDSKHDDQHINGEMAIAAACYAVPPPRPIVVKRLWPWDMRWWKPVMESSLGDINGRIRELEKAGALIAAEIDRLQRVSG